MDRLAAVSIRRAASILSNCTYRAGVTFISDTKRRAKLRGLIAARAASVSTDRCCGDTAQMRDVKRVSSLATYADVGQLFAQTTMAEPRLAAVMMAQLIKGMGADHVCWGTDAIWTGSPQWQIEALRRLEIPEELQKKYGFAALGPADGPVKTAIFGSNNARLYDYRPQQRAELEGDKLAEYKTLYEKHGAGRTNLAYGYVRKPV